jgi:hypothetical protein
MSEAGAESRPTSAGANRANLSAGAMNSGEWTTSQLRPRPRYSFRKVVAVAKRERVAQKFGK